MSRNWLYLIPALAFAVFVVLAFAPQIQEWAKNRRIRRNRSEGAKKGAATKKAKRAAKLETTKREAGADL